MTAGAARSGAILLTIGDELLLGRTVDTNSAWLARALADHGVRVRAAHTLGDAPEAIGRALLDACAGARVVILTGGLGPTEDDRTREAVSAALQRPLRTDAGVMDHLERWYRERDGTEPPEIVRRIAQVHEGAEVVPNAIGTAPGLVLEHEGTTVVLLPGVPREMRALFERVAPRLREAGGGRAVAVRQWETSGIPESRLAPRIEEALESAGIRREVEGHGWELAWLPGLRGVGLRATLPEAEPGVAEALLARIAGVIDPVIAPWRLPDHAQGEVVRAVARELTDRGLTVATAESCTGGLVAKRMTDLPGSSAWFLGSVVAYSNEAKSALLGVDPGVIEAHGAVSEEVAFALADGAVGRFGADAAIGITGIAGPGGARPGKPVGTVCWSVRVGGTRTVRRHRFHGDREAVRERAAQAALMLLLRLLEEES